MKPTKEEVRLFMQQRQEDKRNGKPMPSSEEIRRQLGWQLQEKYVR